MPQVSNISSQRRIRLGDICVLAAMMVVAAAFGTGLFLNAGLTPLLAAAVAVMCWIALMSAHVLIRRERLVTTIGRELERLEDQVGSMVTANATVAKAEPPMVSSPAINPRTAAPVDTGEPFGSEVAAPVQRAPEPARTDERKVVGRPPQLPPEFVRAAEQNIVTAELSGLPSHGARMQGFDDGASDTPRTVTPNLEAVVPSREPELPKVTARGGDSASSATQIDSIIKRLADDISAGRRSGAGSTSAPAAPEFELSTPQPRLELPPLEPQIPVAPELAIPDPVSNAADNDLVIDNPTDDGPASAKIAAIADALMQERIDVFLEPILGLDDHQARHYEVSARLRMADGLQLDHEAYSAAAKGSGLLPLIDAVKVSHTKRIALQLINRGRSGSFFSQINGEALSTPQFGTDVGTITSKDPAVAARLVLSFSQNDVRGFTPIQLKSLAQLKTLGFRFAMESVTDLDMDFEQLVDCGFVFAKLDADVFVAGLPAPNGPISATDICRFLAEAGLTMIVQSIESERQLAEILGFGAIYGQGTLFGGPRPVKAHVLRGDTAEGVSASA